MYYKNFVLKFIILYQFYIVSLIYFSFILYNELENMFIFFNLRANIQYSGNYFTHQIIIHIVH